MAILRFLCLTSTVLLVTMFAEILGHGKLMNPVNRSSAWRMGFKNPTNTDDNANYCGGIYSDMEKGDSIICGLCGDSYTLSQPRPNENGGEFGNGIIVKKYRKAERIQVTVDLNTNHKGNFNFALCPLDGPKDIETEDCFKEYPLKGRMIAPYRSVGAETYFFGPINMDANYTIELQLPTRLRCKHCSFRWEYVVGNNVGFCLNGTERLGCGPQEVFRNCADIRIE